MMFGAQKLPDVFTQRITDSISCQERPSSRLSFSMSAAHLSICLSVGLYLLSMFVLCRETRSCERVAASGGTSEAEGFGLSNLLSLISISNLWCPFVVHLLLHLLLLLLHKCCTFVSTFVVTFVVTFVTSFVMRCLYFCWRSASVDDCPISNCISDMYIVPVSVTVTRPIFLNNSRAVFAVSIDIFVIVEIIEKSYGIMPLNISAPSFFNESRHNFK